MPWQVWLFVLLPCGAALVLGLAVTHRATAAGAVVLSLGLFLAAAAFAVPRARPVLPLATGAAVAGLGLVVLLSLKPGAGPGLRAAVAVGAALAAHLSFLQFALAHR